MVMDHIVRPRGSAVEEKSYLRTALLGFLVVAAVVLTVNTSNQGAKSMSLAGEETYGGPPPPSVPPSAYPPPLATTYPPPPMPAAAPAMAEEEESEASAPEAVAPPPGAYSYQPTGSTAGTVSTGCSGGNCGEAGPTTAAAGKDATVADYDKVKIERRQAMDFCDAHFSAWVNIQKCIAELFLNARY